ncbi:30S ribosomal protein S4 [Candidatus Woesearchaeota archaeon]|nr:30S ribosomal protein S4 [Candidatus Woesearchaeota archaeon]
MGDPRRLRKKYETPGHPWQASRMKLESELMKAYGLKNKRELWKTSTFLKKAQDRIKKLTALRTEQAFKEQKQIIQKLARLGLVQENASSDDVLGIDLKSVFERRLQTIVYRKGLARSVKQARQFIVHKHIEVDGRIVTSPSYLVSIDEEASVRIKPGSPVEKLLSMQSLVEEQASSEQQSVSDQQPQPHQEVQESQEESKAKANKSEEKQDKKQDKEDKPDKPTSTKAKQDKTG